MTAKGVERRGEKGNRSGLPRADDAVILGMYEKGMSQGEIAQELRSRGLGPSTQQGVGFRIRQILDKRHLDRILPVTWRVRVEHSGGWIYLAALAYAKWQQGRGMTPVETRNARRLEAKLNELGAVLTYDREQGFQIRNRRPDDAGLLV